MGVVLAGVVLVGSGHDGSCPSGELLSWGIFLGGSCPG